jgi:hypothetical protein
MTMNILRAKKQRRGNWLIETDGPFYATVELKAAFFNGSWKYGWHALLRGNNGAVVKTIAFNAERMPATRDAYDELSKFRD